MIKRANCLYRVSTKGQVDKDDIPMQRQACREYAEQMGWTITNEYYEKGISGFKVSAEKRDAIQDLKVAAEITSLKCFWFLCLIDLAEYKTKRLSFSNGL